MTNPPIPPENCQQCGEPLDDADNLLYCGLCRRCRIEAENAVFDAYLDRLHARKPTETP